MILVDTNVWIDHLRQAEQAMREQLAADNVAMHPMVIGELACGNLPRREETLAQLRTLPGLKVLDDEAVLALIESNKLMGRGIGLVDAHLLGAVLAGPAGTLLWTRDRRLRELGDEAGVAYFENGVV